MVFRELQNLIIQGVFRPGDNLPSEVELAEQFGVGRSSIREAMQALQLKGVVEVIQGKGSFVREVGILPLVVDWARISQMSIISEVMEARKFVEVLLVQLAAERATDEDIQLLKQALEHSRETIPFDEKNMETNALAGVEFHMAVAEAAHNQVLALMYRTVRDLYLETAKRTRISPEVSQDRLHDHEEILQAILSRNPESAANIMRNHIDKACQILTTGHAEEK
jgi:GntR family transcriptional repressor for pyruvate dehydrogenase complex